METLWQDIRQSFRKLLKAPGFTFTALLALALGIGANSAIFSVVNTALLRPLAFPDPDRLVMVWENNLKKGVDQMPLSAADYLDFRNQNDVFAGIAALRPSNLTLTGVNEPERIPSAMVTASMFPMLGVTPIFGRTFLPDEDQPGKNTVVLISSSLWQRRFQSDPAIVGKALILNGQSYNVVGVMQPNFRLSKQVDAWIPLVIGSKEAANRSVGSLVVVGRLKPGVTYERAQTSMDVIASRLSLQYPETNTDHGVKIISLHEQLTGNIRLALLLVLAAVAFVLLIACANVSNLLMARAASRQKEMAIRTALGANRGRLIRQLLTESVILSLVGGLLGLVLAYLGLHLIVATIPESIPRVQESSIDLSVLGFTFIVSLLTGTVFGLAPAMQASKTDMNESLKERSRGSMSGVAGRRLRNLLVVSEVTLTLVLLVGAGLTIRSFTRLQDVKPGFNPDHLLTMQLTLPPSKYPEPQQQVTFYKESVERIKGVPGVQSVGLVSALPMGASNNIVTAFEIEGRAPAASGENLAANYVVVSPDYFRTMNIPIQKGSVFTESDAPAQPKAVINETMAHRYFQNQDPLGKHLMLDVPPEPISAEIIGVVADVKQAGLDSEVKPVIYVSYLQAPWPAMSLVARTTREPMDMVSVVRGQLLAIDKDQPIYNVQSMEQLMADSVAQPRLTMLLLGIFAAVALILAGTGIYGVISYSVAQRTQEIGLRMAMGAQQLDILKMVVGQGMLLAVVGIVLGLFVSVGVTRLVASLLFGVSATDLTTLTFTSLLLAVVTLLACCIPARRAMRLDPIVALRYE
jgi:putative ABC transport system permease protein